ncbi:MAG TPA: cytochrome c biogenesis protein ResB [bacterium]|nr:cytochrome c biogenesis protein ResB [bacterium]
MKPAAGQKQGWVDFLASLKVTVYTLIVLSLACLAGTIIPQKGVSLQPEVLAEKLHEPLWHWLNLLGFLDVFHSVWFFLLILLLVVNLVLCTIRFIQRTARQLRRTSAVLDDAGFAALPLRQTVQSSVAPDKPADFLAERLRRIGRVTRTESGGVIHLFAQNSPLHRYASVLIHLSILFVIAGAVLRILFGVEGQLLLPEGGMQNIFSDDAGAVYRLPADVRCDRFEVEMYADGRRPKDYRSDLVVIENGRETRRKTIEVNDPLRIGPYRLFQASYGRESFPLLTVDEHTMPVMFDHIQSIPGTRDGLRIDKARNTDAGLQIHINVFAGDALHDAWLTEKGEPARLGPYKVAFADHREGFYTGLMVTADPGVKFVWIGSALFFFAFFWAMWTTHRRAWVRIAGDTVTIGATARKRREQLSAWLEETVREMENPSR